MYLTEREHNKSNRRIALRVYERANLSYQKISNGAASTSPSTNGHSHQSVAQAESFNGSGITALPFSRSQQNDTLNVNISASGIAFTCHEAMQAGETLLLRILFLSNMTTMVTSGKVIYCKPSNPYETNRHPYTVGVQFLNMTAEDTALLNRHVGIIRKQQFVINGLIAMAILAVLSAPGHAWELFVELLHHAVEIILHLLHLGFEFLEMGLDHYIEHHFHTGTHETQVAVFYIIVGLGLVPLYFLARKAWRAMIKLKANMLLYAARKKSSFIYFWSQQTGMDKFKIVGLGCSALAGYIYFNL
jgi:PilZ domain